MENGKRIRVLTIKYTADIAQHEVSLFRGAVIAAMGGEANILFHNHIDDGKLRYSYPLVQYKRIGGKAAMVFINDAIMQAKSNITFDDINITLGKKSVTMRIEKVDAAEVDFAISDTFTTYTLNSWLPLNTDNYNAFIRCDSLIEKLELLQNILIGNIISLAKGLGIDVDRPIVAHITDYNRPHKIVSKGVEMLAFDVEFKANIILPENIGLGKSVSKGHGNITLK